VIEQIRDVVRKLDRPRSQVLIEAVIAEVSQEQANRLNVQLAGASRYTGGILTNFDNLIPTLIGVAADGNVSDSELSNINLNTGAYLSAGDFDQNNGEAFGVIVDALRTDSRTTILSSPSVVTLDNSEAELTVGQEVPFITGSYTNSNNSSSNPFQTIEREEVGVKLKVIPQINEGDAVRLEIEQESSSIAGTATSLGTADTVTNKRTITTNVMVGDGQLLILGGLMDDNFGRTDRKVPILGDLPILGALFRSRNNNDDQRVLMMFIRPTILRSPAQSTATTNRRFDYLRNYDMGNGQTLGETPNTVLQQFEAGNQEESQGTPVPEDN
jgi:general secretion pathway protein D